MILSRASREGIVFVDDGFVDQRPQRFGRLHFRGVGGLEDEANAVRHGEAGFAVPDGVVERPGRCVAHARRGPPRRTPAARASKNGLDHPRLRLPEASPWPGELRTPVT